MPLHVCLHVCTSSFDMYLSLRLYVRACVHGCLQVVLWIHCSLVHAKELWQCERNKAKCLMYGTCLYAWPRTPHTMCKGIARCSKTCTVWCLPTRLCLSCWIQHCCLQNQEAWTTVTRASIEGTASLETFLAKHKFLFKVCNCFGLALLCIFHLFQHQAVSYLACVCYHRPKFCLLLPGC